MSNGRYEFIIELRRVGNAVKATACDPVTLREACIVGSAASPPAMLERAAIRKLEALLAREGAQLRR